MARWLVVLTACGLALAAVATAQECPEIVAVLPYGEPDVVAVEGSYAYVGIKRGLLVVDESDSADLRSVARLAMPGIVRGITVAGGRAYVTLGEDGVRVVDSSDPTDPRIVQAVDTPGEAQGVKVAGNTLFVASGSAGLCAVSPGADPPLLGCVDTPEDARDVDLSGTLAVVADGAGGLVVVDVSDPAHMVVLGSAAMQALAVEAQGSLAHVACGDGSLRVVDMSQPASPAVIGELAVPGAADVDVDGNLVVMAALSEYASPSGVRVVDVSTPSAPVQVGSLTVHGVEGRAQVVLHGDRATLGGLYGVTLVDLSAPTVPVEMGRLPTGVFNSVEVDGHLAVLGRRWGSNTSVVDLSQPNRPRELSVLPPPYGWPAALSGTWLFLSAVVTGPPTLFEVDVVDLSDPLHPSVVATHEIPDYGELLTLSENLLHVMDGNTDIHFIDVTTPWSPVEVGMVERPTGWYVYYATYEIAAIPGYLYRGGMVSGSPPRPGTWGWSEVVDVMDPSLPTPLPTPPLEVNIPVDLRVDEGALVYLGSRRDEHGTAHWSAALYDLDDPTDPQWAGGGELPVRDWDQATRHGRLLWASARDDHIVRGFDLDGEWDPAGIAEVSLGEPWGLATSGRHLLVADRELGLVVLDTSCVGGLFADGFESGGTGGWSEVWP